jgi:hypothetical protein
MPFLAHLHRFFRGAIKFRFVAVRTEMHSCRLRLAYYPHDYNTAQATSIDDAQWTSYHIDWDIQKCAEIEYTCPYLSIAPLLPTSAALGQLLLYVVNPMVAPTTVSSTINIEVYVAAGNDFAVAVQQPRPCQVYCTDWDVAAAARLRVGRNPEKEAHAQAAPWVDNFHDSLALDDDDPDDDLSFLPYSIARLATETAHAQSGPALASPALVQATPSSGPTDLHLFAETTGEFTLSLLTMLKRYQAWLITPGTASTEAAIYRLKSKITAYFNAGVRTTSEWTPTMFDVIPLLYAFERGSAHYWVPRNDQELYVSVCDTRDLPPGQTHWWNLILPTEVQKFFHFNADITEDPVRIPGFNQTSWQLARPCAFGHDEPIDALADNNLTLVFPAAQEWTASRQIRRRVGDDYQCAEYLGIPPLFTQEAVADPGRLRLRPREPSFAAPPSSPSVGHLPASALARAPARSQLY